MKIIDSFTFYNEFDILELRLRTMYNQVDRFVIVESDHTFTGIYKDFNLEKNLDRFSPWMDKIQYIKAINSNPSQNAWNNEDWQRDQMINGWQDVGPDDVIILGDVDEIVRPEAIEYIKNTNYDLYGLFMPAFYFKFNYMDTKPDWHYKIWSKAFRGTPTMPGHKLRYTIDIPGKSKIGIHHAGWHFGWIGDADFARNKIKSFSHQEINRSDILENINIEKHISEGRDHFRPENVTWQIVNIDNYFPEYLLKNKEKYSKFILPDSGKTAQDFWKNKIVEPTLLN